MNRFWKILGNFKLLKWLFLVTSLVYAFLVFANAPWDFVLHNNDNYKGLFSKFLNLGYYDAVSNGTSILYNLFLKQIYSYTNNIESSFIILNSLSLLFLMVFGVYFLKKVTRNIDLYFLIVVVLYSLFMINLRSYASASNDTFLGVFVVILLYVLVQPLISKGHLKSFVLIGFFLALCLAIRMTAILLIPLIVYCIIVWSKQSNEKVVKKSIKIFTAFIVFVLFTALFHFPSLKEHGTLSSYNKNPENISANWTQRNYLGLKKIENGEETLHRDAIWHRTKFDEVVRYLNENGEDSLPKSFFEVLKSDPFVAIKMFGYNVIFSILRFFRFWGFLFFLMIIPLYNIKRLKNTIYDRVNLTSNLFLGYMLMLSFVCFTFIEFRWFYGYEILIPIAVLIQIQNQSFFERDINRNILFSTSLVCITFFNLRSIFNLL